MGPFRCAVDRDRGIGAVWQNRFNSCTLGPRHLWPALRYVELNPVRARLVGVPREYVWSSAEAHLSGEDPWRIADMRFWSESGGAESWRMLLLGGGTEAAAEALRRATYSGQPFGDEEVVEALRAQREKARGSGGQARVHLPMQGVALNPGTSMISRSQ